MEGIEVTMNSGAHSNNILYTRHLNGCIALVSRTQRNGSWVNSHGIMTHYFPSYPTQHLARIDELLDGFRQDVDKGTTKAVLFYPDLMTSNQILEGFQLMAGKNAVIKPIEYSLAPLDSLDYTKGILRFDPNTGRYDFDPFSDVTSRNIDEFHNFLR